VTAWVLPTRAATSRFGEALGRRLGAGDTIALIGDLGAGKTTLARAIARGCGITSPVSSPTFGLIHEYPGRLPLFHFDPYRLQRAEDLSDLGFHEFFDRGGVVLVEWADKVEQLLPPERITLRLEIEMERAAAEFHEDSPRLLEVQANGQRYLDLLTQLADAPELRDLRAPGTEI
jgi:tRNA threonylcarbamoyladenosine biosynthesis protein TsaE